MLRDITIDYEDIPVLCREIEHVKHSGDVLLIHGGADVIQKDRWIELIETHCNLIPDRRHFDPQWAANSARHNAMMHRRITQVTDSEAFDPTSHSEVVDGAANDQMRPADWWEISYQPDREIAYAYSKTPQPLHTDNAWFGDPAEINFFIMEKQSPSGGEQTIYPVTRLVEDLAAEERGLLIDLSSIEVVVKKGDNDMWNKTCVIRLESQPKVFWNYYRTEKGSPEVAAMCEAFFNFLMRKTDTNSVERIRCETGDCMSFNDLHMLHGRTAFEAQNPRDRVLLHSMWKMPSREGLQPG